MTSPFGLDRLAVVAIALALGAGCEADGALVRDPGEELEIALTAVPDATEEEGDKVLWRLSDVTVAVQRARRSRVNEAASLDEVAEAWATVHEARGDDGSMSWGACALAGRTARCLDGSIIYEGVRHARRGFLFESGDDLVLLDVIGEPGAEARLDAQYRRIEESLRWLEDPT